VLRYSVAAFGITGVVDVSITGAATSDVAVANYQGLWWASPPGSQSGWGINFAHQGDVIFATWFTYGQDGKPLWLVATLERTAAGAYSGNVVSVTGVPFSAVPWDTSKFATAIVGTMSVAFADRAHATLAYTVDGIAQTKAIELQTFAAPVPTCVWGKQADLTLATNYQDLWWAAPAGSESGWGAFFTHQGDIIFVTWYTYGPDGKPTWFVASAQKSADKVYAGAISTVIGNPFNAQPWDVAKEVVTNVGSLAITFSDGINASFAYQIGAVAQAKPITRQVFAPPGTICQ
jgi:hypothetical protein